MNANKIPDIIIGRLPVYLRALQQLSEKGIMTTSSQELGEIIGISAAQIRKDISQFGEFGKQGTGYSIPFLIELLQNPEVAEREQLLCLIHTIATGSSYLDVHVRDGAWGAAEERAKPDFEARLQQELSWVASAHSAAAEGIGFYEELLHDHDATIRAGAAHTLTAFPESGDRIAPP